MRILITGATGLIGSHLTKLFRENEIAVNFFTTRKEKVQQQDDLRGFLWDPQKGKLDKEAFEGVNAIIHLAGENIAQRWTPTRRRRIIASRVKTAEMMQEALERKDYHIRHFISASGIGVYPSSLEKLYYEEEKEIDASFVGKVVVQWEEAANEFSRLGMAVTKIRIGLVLANNGGFLDKIKGPISVNLGASLGNERQWQSWIHIHDLARIFLHVVLYKLSGTYNAVSPNPVPQYEMMRSIARIMEKPLWLPNIPPLVIRLVFGKMSRLLLSSQLVSSQKIEETGFRFEFKNLNKALENLLQD